MTRQMMNPFRCLAVAALGCIASLLPVSAGASAEQEWRFRVYLDDREIGHHYFKLTRDGMEEKLATQAKFDVTFLKIPLFSYRHDNVERWSDKCLEEISSNTDQNGKQYRVEGLATGKGFHVRTHAGEQTLPACVSTFAYWDKSFLQRDRLLNSQTGEYLAVEVDYLGEKSLALQAADVQAHHYRLTANDLDIEIWYSRDDQWLALQSTTDSGRLLRYIVE